MNLKKVFSLALLVALPLGAAAQTNSAGPGQPQTGTRINRPRRTAPVTYTNNAVSAVPKPAAATPPDSTTTTPPANTATNAGQPSQPMPAAPASAAPAEVADIKYNWTMPVEQVLDDIYAPLVGRTPLQAVAGASAVPKDALITLHTQADLTKSEAIMALETDDGHERNYRRPHRRQVFQGGD